MSRRRSTRDDAQSSEANEGGDGSTVVAERATRTAKKLMMPSQKMSGSNVREVPKKKYGLLKATIGTTHMVRFKVDGKLRQAQMEVQNVARHQNASAKAICITCKRTYDTLEDLRDDHLDDHELKAAMEAHVYALWSDDPAQPAIVEGIAASIPDFVQGGPVKISSMPIGLLSDE